MTKMFITFQLVFRESCLYMVYFSHPFSKLLSHDNENKFHKGFLEGKVFYYFVYCWFINYFPDIFLGI